MDLNRIDRLAGGEERPGFIRIRNVLLLERRVLHNIPLPIRRGDDPIRDPGLRIRPDGVSGLYQAVIQNGHNLLARDPRLGVDAGRFDTGAYGELPGIDSGPNVGIADLPRSASNMITSSLFVILPQLRLAL